MGMEVIDTTDMGIKMSKLLTLPGIIPTKLNHFLPLQYRAPGLESPCLSYHLPPYLCIYPGKNDSPTLLAYSSDTVTAFSATKITTGC